MSFTHTFAVNYRANLVTVLINVEGGPYLTKITLTESGALALAAALGKDEKGVVELVDGTISIALRDDESAFHALEIQKNSKEKSVAHTVYCKHGSQREHLIENLKVAADAVSG